MRWLVALAGLTLAAGPAAAQQALYEPLPPKGSAYVRFVNGLVTPLKVEADFAPAFTLGAGTTDRVGPYTVVENVDGRTVTVPVSSGSAKAQVGLTLKSGSFNTVLWVKGASGPQASVLTDETQFNQLRAKLSFTNVTADCAAASLTLLPDGPEVFQEVAPTTTRMRAVNPVEARIQAACGGAKSAEFALNGLEAGGRASIWLMRPDKSVLAFMTRDATTPWRR